jgi:hypothetical protein
LTRTIQISDETYERLKDQLGLDATETLDSLDSMVGQCWFIRTVTYHTVGRIMKRIGGFFLLSGAAWVPDSGRFTQAIKNGTLNEVEPIGTCMVQIACIVDMFPWKHKLPMDQK